MKVSSAVVVGALALTSAEAFSLAPSFAPSRMGPSAISSRPAPRSVSSRAALRPLSSALSLFTFSLSSLPTCPLGLSLSRALRHVISLRWESPPHGAGS